MDIQNVIDYLKAYDGPPIKLMEVCGTHTSSIFKNGIRSLISPKITLISGPGCPVCVTPTAYIDQCIRYAMQENHVLLTFGDMMKVPGTEGSLSDMKGKGAKVELMYSPFEAVEKAERHPDITWVVAAVGFETTAPSYALMMQQAVEKGIRNIRLVTALKTVIPALRWICENQMDIDGFICPGHVSVIIGSKPYEALAREYKKPFVIAGFEAEHILAVIYDLVRQIEKKEASWLLGFCNNASPAFLMTYFVAEQLHHPEKTPETLLLLYGIPALICLLPLFFKQIRHPVQPFSPADTDCTKKASNHALSFALFDACISDAIAVMLKLGGYITLFAVLSNAIANIPHLSSGCAALLCAAFEITNGIPAVMAAFPYPQSYVILLPFLTFGGVCSLMQTGSVIKDTPLSWRSYFLCKLLLAVPVLFAGLLIA